MTEGRTLAREGEKRVNKGKGQEGREGGREEGGVGGKARWGG